MLIVAQVSASIQTAVSHFKSKENVHGYIKLLLHLLPFKRTRKWKIIQYMLIKWPLYLVIVRDCVTDRVSFIVHDSHLTKVFIFLSVLLTFYLFTHRI